MRRVDLEADEARGWPWSVPAVRQLADQGLDLPQALVLVGENGAGKSTIVEALAEAYGLNPEGGSTGAMHVTHRSESDLADAMRLQRGAGAARWGYFLRAETMHSFFTYLADEAQPRPGVVDDYLHTRSHGESFLALVESRFFTPSGKVRPGLYVFDEPESALSLNSSLNLLATLVDMLTDDGVQIVLATHSPILAALPGAKILRLDADGYAPAEWGDLEMVIGLKGFLADPKGFLRHLDD